MKLVLRHNDTLKAFLLLGLIIIIVYFPITLLNHTLDPSFSRSRLPVLDLQRDFECHTSCVGPINWTIDPGADGDSDWPNARLVATLYSEGILPLWNPYLAAGTPLAAETINFAFSPMMVFYLLSNSYWDVPLLVSVLLAGIFTYLLLKSWNLNFVSSLSGGTIFMLSGAITWYLPHVSIPVVIFTPLILFSIEKYIREKNHKYIIIGSLAVAVSILGGHLESIVLVLLLCISYSAFRILYLIFSNYNNRQNSNNLQGIVLQSKKRAILKISLIFFAGLGLSAFFILPVGEYLLSGVVGRDTSTGISANTSFTIATTFIPYLFGPIHIYGNPALASGSWDLLGGYVVASSLLFSIVGITFSDKLFQYSLNKRIAQFFFGIAIFFMLKSIGFPIINLIGTIPIFDHIVFPRYDGFIFTLGLAISAAFGIEIIQNQKIKLKYISIVTLITFSIIIASALLIVPYFTKIDLSAYYATFQVLQSLFFILMAFLLILAYHKKKYPAIVFFFLFFLESSLYIPFGLTPWWQFYRSILVILGAIALCSVIFLPFNKIKSCNQDKIKLILFIIISGLSMIGQVIVYIESPQGLPIRHDAFSSTPITNFLDGNLKNSRIFSYDGVFLPNHPAAYQIQAVGIISAQQISWFNSFVHNALDPYAISTVFDYAQNWRTTNSTSIENTFLVNQKYYNFLGVKYIVSNTTDPNIFMFGPPGADGSAHIGSTEKSIVQEFKSPISRITSINVQLGTYDQQNHGKIVLSLDSIPYNVTYHRDAFVNAEDIIDGKFQKFQLQPLNNIKNKLFSLSIKFIPDDPKSVVAAFYYDGHQSPPPLDMIKNLTGGTLLLNNSSSNGILAFSVNSDMFSPVFRSQNLVIYENLNVFPRAFLVNKYQVTNSYTNAQNIIKDQNFDLRKEVVLENDLNPDQSNMLKSDINSSSNAEIILYSADKVTIHTSSESAALLVLTDTYYSGWKAYVDGKETPIYRADGLVRAIFVPMGNHDIEFLYMPNSFVVGLIITMITAGILIGLFAYSKQKEQIHGSVQSPEVSVRL